VASLRGEDSLAIIDTASLSVRSKIKICKEPTDLSILPDSSKVFAACSGSSQVASVQLRKEDIRPPQSADALLAILNVGKVPVHLALKPDGGEMFVSNFEGNTISEIASSSNEVGGSYLIGSNPSRGLAAPDNATLYVTNFGSDTLAIYNFTVNKLIATVHVGSRPDSLALSSGDKYLFVADTGSGDIAVIRTEPNKDGKWTMTTVIPVQRHPNALAVKAIVP
jgi:YVTN family beta-propeller protein